ncbi:hypothetical protein [Dehalogenimonas formicexedens]|uniref:hypothetical protein n=1 Tax=Dehalogenimonas formicexedens TaxID=1839801 RepID=UPI001314BC11|nr:hypothetical protein [Dehalogenimonas formicexedens]
MDFSISKYQVLCKAISKSGYTSITLADYLKLDSDHKMRPYLIMRHDIDRNPERTLDIARLEYDNGIKATYYFRTSTASKGIMDKVASYGHEIGFHYETIDKMKGDVKSAIDLFKNELAQFRVYHPIVTACAHGNPLTKHDNKHIWKHCRLSEFKLIGEAFLSLDFARFAYFSDSGRTWRKSRSQKMHGKDDVGSIYDYLQPKDTDELVGIINAGTPGNICVLTHPERWCSKPTDYIKRYVLDLIFSAGKTGIHLFRTVSRNNI